MMVNRPLASTVAGEVAPPKIIMGPVSGVAGKRLMIVLVKSTVCEVAVELSTT